MPDYDGVQLSCVAVSGTGCCKFTLKNKNDYNVSVSFNQGGVPRQVDLMPDETMPAQTLCPATCENLPVTDIRVTRI